jgi:wyosine [tRNA(Phe)-imidazoG37] synthetase (radical SAM superfamily)
MASNPTVDSVSDPAVPTHWLSVRDHSRSFWDFTYVYPVVSRRSRGLSIGINLNPDKVCNFDCVYCEVDRVTPPRTRTLNLLQVRAELAAMIRLAQSGELGCDPKFIEAAPLTRIIRDIAFSGDGEPTMVPNFDECVQVAVDLKTSQQLTDTRIVLITDAAGLDKASVRRGLALMDIHQGDIWAKLDAGTEDYFRKVNRSHVRFDRILSNLLLTASQRPIVIQSLFLRIHGEPITDAELGAYCDRLNELTAGGGRIREVHAYTIARPTPEPWATRLSREELDSRASVIRGRTGLKVEVFE